MEYLVVVEKGESSYGAYVPDLPGCVAVAETRREVMKSIREGIELHTPAASASGLGRSRPSRSTYSPYPRPWRRFARGRAFALLPTMRFTNIRLSMSSSFRVASSVKSC